jgi:hypothetical protein
MQVSLEVLENFVPAYYRNARATFQDMNTYVNKNTVNVALILCHWMNLLF